MEKYFQRAIEFEKLLEKYAKEHNKDELEIIQNKINKLPYIIELRKYQNCKEVYGINLKNTQEQYEVCEMQDKMFIAKSISYIELNEKFRFRGMRYHKHNFVELIYVYKGNYSQYIDGTLHIHKKGDVCLLNTNVFHRDDNINKDSFIIYLCLDKSFFNIDYLNKFNIYDDFIKFLRRQEESKESRDYIFFNCSQEDEIEELIDNIAKEFYYKEQGYLYVIKGYIERLVYTLFNRKDIKIILDQEKSIESRVFKEIDRYIKINLNDISREKIGFEFYYNPNHINKIIKQNTGQSYSEYIKNLKLEQAIEMLKIGKYSVNEIISKLGYSNKTYFYKIFLEKYKITPKEYKILYQDNFK